MSKFKKRLLALAAVAVVVLAGAVWIYKDAQGRVLFDIQDPAWIVLQGQEKCVTVQDPVQVNTLTDAFNELRYSERPSGGGRSVMYTLTWFNAQGEQMESAKLIRENVVEYNGSLYRIQQGQGISESYLLQCIEGLPESGWDNIVPVYRLGDLAPGCDYVRFYDDTGTWSVEVHAPAVIEKVIQEFQRLSFEGSLNPEPSGEPLFRVQCSKGKEGWNGWEVFAVMDARTLRLGDCYDYVASEGELDLDFLLDLTDPHGSYARNLRIDYWVKDPGEDLIWSITGAISAHIFPMPGVKPVDGLEGGAEVTAPADLNKLEKMFSEMEYRRGERAPAEVEGICQIIWMNNLTSAGEITTGRFVANFLTVVDEETVIYDGMLCKVTGGKIDTAWLESLLAEREGSYG